MRKLFIIAIGIATLGAATLGAWFVPPASGAIKTSMQKKAERDLRERLLERRNLNPAKPESEIPTVPYGTGVYKLVR